MNRTPATIRQHAVAIRHKVVRPSVRWSSTSPQSAVTIPRGAWDAHMHITDPAYPLSPNAKYTPSAHVLSDALAFESSVGIDNIALVQPSIYGTDNSLILDALRTLKSRDAAGNSQPRHRGCGVVEIEPGATPHETLNAWNDLGVRGVRINLASLGKVLPTAELKDTILRYAEDCHPLDWSIHLHLPMSMIPSLVPIVPRLDGLRICIDHLGYPPLPAPAREQQVTDPYEIPDFDALADLLGQGSTFVKLSAPYRISKTKNHRDLEPVMKEVLRVAGESRVVFATDWPHTRFDGVDIRPFIDQVLELCQDNQHLVDRVFRDNAEDLWRFAHH